MKKHLRHSKWDNTKHIHMYAVQYHEMHYGMFSGVPQQFDTVYVIFHCPLVVCLLIMAHHTEQCLWVNMFLCTVCIHIWTPVSANCIPLCWLCRICYENGLCDRGIYSMCGCSFGSAFSWPAHVSAGLRNSQFVGLRIRPIFLALSTHNSAFPSHSVQALRVMIHVYSIS